MGADRCLPIVQAIFDGIGIGVPFCRAGRLGADFSNTDSFHGRVCFLLVKRTNVQFCSCRHAGRAGVLVMSIQRGVRKVIVLCGHDDFSSSMQYCTRKNTTVFVNINMFSRFCCGYCKTVFETRCKKWVDWRLV